jgi:hypothetical protein
MSTGLTFGTISALFGLNAGVIDTTQFSLLVTVVVLSAVVPTAIAERWFLPDPRARAPRGTTPHPLPRRGIHLAFGAVCYAVGRIAAGPGCVRQPVGVATGEGTVWVVDQSGTVTEIDTEANAPVGEPVTLEGRPLSLAIGSGAVWVANPFNNTVARIAL